MKTLFLVGMLSLSLSATAGAQGNSKILITVTEDGVGPINATTPFELSNIAKLLPALRVIRGVESTEGIEFPVIRVMDGMAELLVIAPSEDRRRIASIVVTSDRVAHTGKGKVGSLYSEVFGDKLPNQCFMGKEEDSGNVICRASSTSHVRFIFAGTNSLLADGLPPIAVLKTWRVKEMFWLP